MITAAPDFLSAVQWFMDAHERVEVHVAQDAPECYSAVLRERDNDVCAGQGATVSQALSALEYAVANKIWEAA